MRIPESELEIIFSRSSGPGGQNVNKTSSRVQIKWSITRSKAFNVAEKARLMKHLHHRLVNGDELMMVASQERSQQQNRDLAYKRLNNLVVKSLELPKKRVPTKPTISSYLKRLKNKRKVSLLKKSRKLISD